MTSKIVTDINTLLASNATGQITATKLRQVMTDVVNLAAYVNVKDYGAKGDGVTDDTAAIQAAINDAIYTDLSGTGSTPHGRVFVPAGAYVTSDTIHLGYGTDLRTVVLEGENTSYFGNPAATRILPTFADRPCIAVSGGRNVRIRFIELSGKAGAYITTNNFGNGSATVDDTAAATWVDPALLAANANMNSRYAPYAGIAIDPYAGTAPSPAYPNVTFPSFLSGPAQYGKSTSSNVIIEDCHVTGFVVGVVIHPSNVASNGDFVTFRDATIEKCVYGLSIGDSQSRNVNFFNGAIQQCFTAFVNNVHGQQIGVLGGARVGINIDQCINIFKFNLGYTQPLLFSGCYGEQLWRLGTGSQSSTACAVVFDSCEFDFTVSQTAVRGAPATMADSMGQLVLRNCQLTAPSHMQFDCISFIAEGTQFIANDCLGASPTVARQLSSNWGLNGCSRFEFMGWEPSDHVMAPIYYYVNNTSISNWQIGPVLPVQASNNPGRQLTFSRLTERVNWSKLVQLAAVAVPKAVVIASGQSGDATSFTGISGTIDFGSLWPAPGTGDLVECDQSNTIFLITSMSGTVASVTALNNYHNPGSGNVFRVAVGTTGTWYIGISRIYTTTYPLLATATSGSAVLTAVSRGDGTNSFITTDLAVNDFIFEPPYTNYFPTGTKINTINAGASTITLSANATKTSPAGTLWPTWIRATT